MELTGAEAVIKSLLKEGTEVIFGYPGGAIMPIYDALYDYRDKVNHILVRHEQGAAHAAQGYAGASGKVGVCFATSGPGATNLITGIYDAMMDSVPLVCITGQVGSHLLGSDAFQEADVIGITTPITKWNYQISKAQEIPEIIAKAFHIAKTGRPGPVVIDITKDAQFAKLNFKHPTKINIKSYQPTIEPNTKQIKTAADLLNNAKRPYILVGHGVTIAKAEKELIKVMEKSGIPAASTLLGLSALPADHPLYVGFLGMHGNYGPNLLTNEADVILAVGMRFDDRVTGRLADYATQAKIIHIDIDPAELNKNVKTAVPIVADARAALKALLPYLNKNRHQQWVEKFRDCDKQEYAKVIRHDFAENKNGEIKMPQVIKMISEKTKGEAVIVTDVGQHQMKTARYYRFNRERSLFTSGGSGTMGYALPASMGAQLGAPNRKVIGIIGDGCFQMTIQELATIKQEKLPIKIVILNNNFLGMVRQWQELFFANRYSFTKLENPDFVKVAEGFGIKGEAVYKWAELEEAADRMLESQEAYLLNVFVKKEENVFPMIPTGASVSEVRLE